MNLQVGQRVKPVSTFNFGAFRGPESLEDRGVITRFGKGDDGEAGWIYVEWEKGGWVMDHAGEGGDPDDFRDFGVVPAED